MSSYVYSEFDPSSLTFNVGQYPGRLKAGSTYTISQALKYQRGSETATVRFIFNVTCGKTGSAAGYEVSGIKQSDIITRVDRPEAGTAQEGACFNAAGIRTEAPMKGIHVMTDSKGKGIKVLTK